jgi:transposase-like protein
MKQTSVRERRKFDETFKREAVQNWLASGKSTTVVGEELGINANLLYAWRTPKWLLTKTTEQTFSGLRVSGVDQTIQRNRAGSVHCYK